MLHYKINPTKINWESKDSLLYFNPQHKQKSVFISHIPYLPILKSHIWLSTSGRSHLKWVALSKKSLLVSAQSVNQHLLAGSKDNWGIALPLFHVGGLSILARSYLSKSSYFIYSKKWDAQSFIKFLYDYKITLTSLVPTQVYDIVKNNLSCPHFIRALVVGGENLSPTLYKAARKLNWPLLPSYGLTECGSQVATAPLESLNKKSFPELQILPHVKIEILKQEIIIKSKSLLTGFVTLLSKKPVIFKEINWQKGYFTQDKGSICKNNLQINNSLFRYIKILGEKVNFSFLEEKLMNILLKKSILGRYMLLAIPHERSGLQISLISDHLEIDLVASIVKEFNSKVSPFEKIQQFYFVPDFPVKGIFKISKQALLKKLNFIE